MQPWIIEELWRQDEDEKRRRDEHHREQIRIDAPNREVHDDESREELPHRGVIIIEL